jgi:hypothetical protein
MASAARESVIASAPSPAGIAIANTTTGNMSRREIDVDFIRFPKTRPAIAAHYSRDTDSPTTMDPMGLPPFNTGTATWTCWMPVDSSTSIGPV